MPYYGDPDLLHRAVASVRALREVDWRLTIVEDCHPSGAETERSIRDLGDERIRYLRNETNLGVAANTFRCLRLAEFDYFVLMDYDDMMLPNYGSEVSALFQRYPKAAVVQPGIEVIDENDTPYLPLPDRIKAYAGPVNREVELSGEAAVASLLRGNWSYGPSICYRRSMAADLRYHPDTDAMHDLARLVDLVRGGGSFVVGETVAFQYRRHRSSHSSSGARDGERFRQERLYFDRCVDELAQAGWKSARRAAKLRLYSRLNAMAQVPNALRSGNRALVMALLSHAVR